MQANPPTVIIVPRITRPNTGMVFTRYSWKVTVLEDGKRRYYSLNTADEAIARQRRDAIYERLLNEGAVMARTPERRDMLRHAIDPANTKKYITKVALKKPYKVMIGNEYHGCYATREEAVAKRNEVLGLALPAKGGTK
jgi:hypothetical protein